MKDASYRMSGRDVAAWLAAFVVAVALGVTVWILLGRVLPSWAAGLLGLSLTTAILAPATRRWGYGRRSS